MLPNCTFSRDQLNYKQGDFKNVHYGDVLIRYPTFKNGADLDIPSINDNESLPSKHVVLHDGDLVIADTAEDYTAGKAIELYNTTNQNILSGLHTIPCRPKLPFAPGYLGYYFNSVAMKRKQHPLIQGIKVYSLSRESLMSLSISYPSIREQNKIASLLLRIDERIEVQNKIICNLSSLIKQISHKIVFSFSKEKHESLNSCCEIRTGKKDANKAKNDGKFLFFTCGRETLRIDSFSFSGPSLLISGNGDIGIVKYYDGKFDAYQRTYVLQNFLIDPLFIKLVLEAKLPRLIEKEKNVGAMPYIVVSTLNDIQIPIINKEKQLFYLSCIGLLEQKLNNERDYLELLLLQKSFLLSNLFI
jgi:restriction endonuclease S subunit